MSHYSRAKQGLRIANAAVRRNDAETAAMFAARDAEIAANAATRKTEREATGPTNIPGLVPGDEIRTRLGWWTVTRCNATSVTALSPYDPFPARVAHAKILETRHTVSVAS